MTAQTEQLIPHKQAAKSLHVALHRFEEGIRKGIIDFTNYATTSSVSTGKLHEIWYLTQEQIEEAGIVLRVAKYSELEEPKETRLGVTRRVYNYSLRSARLRLGLTPDQLGKKVGVGGATIAQYESLRSYPSAERAKAIANALSVSVESIFAEWLTEFKLESLPSILDDAHLSLEQALAGNISLPSLPNLEEEVEYEELRVALQESMSTLTDRERRVLDLRFGFSSDGEKLTFAEIARIIGVTRERIRENEAKAFRKLRRARRLIDFVS